MEINVKGVGLLNLSEDQIANLVINARNMRTENIILREEIRLLKEVSQ